MVVNLDPIPDLSLIHSHLPSNYNFELGKIVRRARVLKRRKECSEKLNSSAGAAENISNPQNHPTQNSTPFTIALQFPDGLLKYAPLLIEFLEEHLKVECIVLAEVVYGACCVPEQAGTMNDNIMENITCCSCTDCAYFNCATPSCHENFKRTLPQHICNDSTCDVVCNNSTCNDLTHKNCIVHASPHSRTSFLSRTSTEKSINKLDNELDSRNKCGCVRKEEIVDWCGGYKGGSRVTMNRNSSDVPVGSDKAIANTVNSSDTVTDKMEYPLTHNSTIMNAFAPIPQYDLLIHFGHSCLIPGNNTLYIFVDIHFDVEHCRRMIERVITEQQINKGVVVNKGEGNKEEDDFVTVQDEIVLDGDSTKEFTTTDCTNQSNINQSNTTDCTNQSNIITPSFTVMGTVQYRHTVSLLNNYFNTPLYQSHPLSHSEVLGCTSPKIQTDLCFFIADGRFHMESVMIANEREYFISENNCSSTGSDRNSTITPFFIASASTPSTTYNTTTPTTSSTATTSTTATTSSTTSTTNILFYRYCPFNKRMYRESYDYKRMLRLRQKQIINYHSSNTVGVIYGSVNQTSIRLLQNVLKRLRGKRVIHINMGEINKQTLSYYERVCDGFIQLSCTRLSIDWGHVLTEKFILNSYELWNDTYREMDYYSNGERPWGNYVRG